MLGKGWAWKQATDDMMQEEKIQYKTGTHSSEETVVIAGIIAKHC